MRNLKRVLSLALAVVMVIGMMVMTTGAADYADAGEIVRTEAVDVMSALGVLEGDGTNFNPKAILTREQAAKIICYMLMGPDNAEMLAGTSNYSDVAATRWSAPFIAYCDSLGIIAGNGDGTFSPEGTLTGVAFAKMLLVALGYDAKIEGYVENNDWATNIGSDAIDAGINIKGVDLGAAVSRENAAQMALNTLIATMVKYDTKGTSVTINGAEIVTGASEAEARVWGTTPAGDVKDYDGATVNGDETAATDTIQFCEKYFSDLYQDHTAINGKTGYTWKITGQVAPASDFVVTEKVIATSTDGTAIYHAAQPSLTKKDTTNPKFKAELDGAVNGTAVKVFVNGTEVEAYQATAAGLTAGKYYYDTTNDAVCLASAADAWADINGNGVKVELINTDRDPKAEKIYFTTYVVNVVEKAPVIKTNTVDTKDYIYIDMTNDIGISTVIDGGAKLASAVKGYEGLAKDDVVLVTTMANGDVTIEKLTAVPGKVTAVSGTDLTINGIVVEAAKAAQTSITSYSNGYQKDVNFFYDSYGYTVRSEAITAVSNDYLLVLANDTYHPAGNFSGAKNNSKVVLSNGTVATITVSQVDTNEFKDWHTADTTWTSAPTQWDIYSYFVNEDGTYTLVSETEVDGTAAITKGVSSMTASEADSTTVFVVHDKKGANYVDSYTVYTGIGNVPSMGTTIAWYAVEGIDNYADIVFVETYANVSTSVKDVIYLLDTTFTTYYKANGSVDYYTAPAIVNGVKTEVKLGSNDLTAYNADTNTDGLATTGTVAAKALYAVDYTDGKLGPNSMTTLASDASGIFHDTSDVIKAPANGVIAVDGKFLAYTEDCVVIVVEANAKSFSVTDVNGYDENLTYTSITVVTEAYGVTSPTAVQSNTANMIILQE